MKTKIGLDFFPVAVDWLDDNKLTLFIEEFGHAGIGVLVRLLGEIYKNGYLAPWTERDRVKFARRADEPLERVTAMVDLLVLDGFFDKELASGDEPVLTSRGIQDRWRYASTRRAVREVDPRFNLLTDCDQSERKVPAYRKQSARNMSAICQQDDHNMSATCTQDADNLRRIATQTETETETKQKQKKKTKAPSGEVIFPQALDTPEMRAAWERFVAHRQAIRKPYKTTEAQNEQLKRWASDPIGFKAAISAAIANEWQGLHPQSEKNKNATTGLLGREERAANLLRKLAEEEHGKQNG